MPVPHNACSSGALSELSWGFQAILCNNLRFTKSSLLVVDCEIVELAENVNRVEMNAVNVVKELLETAVNPGMSAAVTVSTDTRLFRAHMNGLRKLACFCY